MPLENFGKMPPLNVFEIPNNYFLGKLLRMPLKLLPRRMKVPILQGTLKGKKWILGAGVNSYWLGTYEPVNQLLFKRFIRGGAIVFDIGAHVGFYTLLFSHLAGRKGRVFAFEPVPRNLSYLKEHLHLNRISNVEVLESAVSDQCGTATFEASSNSSMGHLDSKGSLQVRQTSLDFLLQKEKLPLPNFIKIDVEWAELRVLHGAKLMISRAHPTIFFSSALQVKEQCCDFLRSMGYELQAANGMDLEKSDDVLATYPPNSKCAL